MKKLITALLIVLVLVGTSFADVFEHAKRRQVATVSALNSAFDVCDEFTTNRAAGSVNGTAAEPGPGTRTVGDTGSILSIASGALHKISGAALAYNRYAAVTRAPGIIGVGKWSHVALPAAKAHCLGFGSNTMSNANQAVAYLYASTIYDTSGNVAITPVVTATPYYIASILRTAGYELFIKGGIYPTWTLVYVEGAANASPVYLGYYGSDTTQDDVDFLRMPSARWLPTPLASDGFGSTFSSTDGRGHAEGVAGGIGSGGGSVPWTGGTWATAAGAAYNTPGLSAELFGNTTFASDTVWVKEAGWSIGSGVATRTNNATTNKIYQNTMVTTGKWYRTAFDITALTTGGAYVTLNGSAGVTRSGIGTNYAQTQRALTTGWAAIAGNTTFAGSIDNASHKEITLADLLASLSSSTADVYASVGVTQAIGFQGGLVLNLDSAATPANFILAYYNRTDNKVYLDKCLSGAYTNLLNVAATYAAGAPLVVRKVGLVYYVFYNNANIGNWTASAVTDAPIINNTLHGLFSTGSGSGEVSLDNFVIYPSGSKGEYNFLDSVGF